MNRLLIQGSKSFEFLLHTRLAASIPNAQAEAQSLHQKRLQFKRLNTGKNLEMLGLVL